MTRRRKGVRSGQGDCTAFVVPAGFKVVKGSCRHHAVSPRRRPAVPAKITMKKVSRGSIQDDESNAVDVFGSVGATQEDLLAAALGGPPEAAKAPKKKKRGGKAGVIEDNDSNAVDVFAGQASNAEDLLAAALGDELPRQKKGKKKKKGSGQSIVGDNAKAEDLLAAAFNDGAPTSKKQKKKVQKEKEALMVSDISEEDDGQTVAFADDSQSSKKKNKMKGAIEEDGSAVSVFEEQMEGALDSTSAGVGSCSDQATLEDGGRRSHKAIETEEVDKPVFVEDDFEPDAEIESEFNAFSEDLGDFTLKGRQEKAKKERATSSSQTPDMKRSGYGTGGEKWTYVRLEDVSVTFRDTTILQSVSWSVQTGERVGLVGENGCGKTTQLKIIAGLMKPNEGQVYSASGRTKAAFLRQEFVDELDPRRTLREELESACLEESELLEEYRKTEKEIETAGDDLKKLEVLLNHLEEVRIRVEELDAWNLDTRINKIMPGLGFTEDDNDKLVASFSGGWKVRIGIGKVLMQNPDLLLLDEPSNHLDNDSVEWLESFLQECALPMVIVSHDREFLDRVATKIVEIEGGEAVTYPGNYSRFVVLKSERRKAWEAAYERQQKFILEQQNYIKRNRLSAARSAQVKSRQKMLERLERTGQLVRRPPHGGKPLIFRFPPAPRSGRDVIFIEDLTHGYEGKVLFDDAEIAIERGDRIALIGPNGAGKTTLLRLITGLEKAQKGTVECEQLHNVKLAYYEQNQADALDLNITVLDTLRKAAPADRKYEELRALLGKFLFKGDSVDKKVGSLSGGEKARLALAKIMLEPANVLILDEPGNHLSISAKEMLEEALQHFDGTLLIVSHDRYLLSQVATQIVAIEDKQLVLYDGDYKSYMEKNAALRERLEARFIPGVAEIRNAPKIVIQEPVEVVDKKSKRKKSFGGSGINSGKTKEMNAKRWKK